MEQWAKSNMIKSKRERLKKKKAAHRSRKSVLQTREVGRLWNQAAGWSMLYSARRCLAEGMNRSSVHPKSGHFPKTEGCVLVKTCLEFWCTVNAELLLHGSPRTDEVISQNACPEQRQYVQFTDSGKRTVRNRKRPFKCNLWGMVIRRKNIN